MNKLTVVIGGCDKYYQAWSVFAHGFNKYWKDCAYPKVFISNELDGPKEFENVKIGKDEGWSTTTRKALEKIDTEYLFWMMEDYWLTEPFNTEKFNRLVDVMIKDDLDHIRLCAPSDDKGNVIPEKECKEPYLSDLGLWKFKDNAEYRASLAPSIWKKSAFMRLLKDGETPWMFESRAGSECQNPEKYICCIDTSIMNWGWYTNSNLEYKTSMIRKSMWTESAYNYIRNEKLDVDLSRWPNGAIVSNNSRIRVPEWLYVGKNSIIDDFCYISTRVEIGKHCHIASNCSIAGGKDMRFSMGDYSSLSSGVKIWCKSNDFVNDLIVCGVPDAGFNNCRGNVELGKYTGVGANSVIMPNNKIPDGVAIGGLSWVPSNFKFEPWTVYAGTPIKPIKARNKDNVLRQISIIEGK